MNTNTDKLAALQSSLVELQTATDGDDCKVMKDKAKNLVTKGSDVQTAITNGYIKESQVTNVKKNIRNVTNKIANKCSGKKNNNAPTNNAAPKNEDPKNNAPTNNAPKNNNPTNNAPTNNVPKNAPQQGGKRKRKTRKQKRKAKKTRKY